MPFGAEYATLPRWNRLERLYIRTFGIVDLPGRLRARLLFRELRRLRARTILDIGAGTGSYAFYMSRNAGTKVHGLEIDARRVSDCLFIAKKLGRNNVLFRAGSADVDLGQVASESMDLVLAIEVLQYCRNVEIVLSEACRVLKPGGHLVAHVPSLGYVRPSETILFNDENLRQFIQEAGFLCCSVTPTFDGSHRFLCRLFEHASALQGLTAVLFPFLLLASLLISTQAASGDYLLLVARKPEVRIGQGRRVFR